MIDDTEAQNQKQEYWEKSMRDSLTGLFNRDAAVQSVNRYMQDGDKAPDGTLMVIDLDNFKEINDTKGHLFGDSVLTEAARCIAGVFDSRIWWEGLAVTSSWYFQNSFQAGKKL